IRSDPSPRRWTRSLTLTLISACVSSIRKYCAPPTTVPSSPPVSARRVTWVGGSTSTACAAISPTSITGEWKRRRRLSGDSSIRYPSTRARSSGVAGRIRTVEPSRRTRSTGAIGADVERTRTSYAGRYGAPEGSASERLGARTQRSGELDPVASGELRPIHRGVGFADHVLRSRVPVGAARDPEARGRDHLLAGDREGLLQLPGQAFGEEPGIAGLRDVSHEDHDELITAVPGDGVGRSNGGRESLRDLDQELVPRPVAERIVHILEVVEVEEDQRRSDAGFASRPGERHGQPIQQQLPVRQSGQDVVDGPMQQLVLDQLPSAEVLEHPHGIERQEVW